MARYAAGIVCRRVDVGVMGERKAVASLLGARSEYVRFVVEASYVAPLYAGYATV
jgi:hypothetical protein